MQAAVDYLAECKLYRTGVFRGQDPLLSGGRACEGKRAKAITVTVPGIPPPTAQEENYYARRKTSKAKYARRHNAPSRKIWLLHLRKTCEMCDKNRQTHGHTPRHEQNPSETQQQHSFSNIGSPSRLMGSIAAGRQSVNTRAACAKECAMQAIQQSGRRALRNHTCIRPPAYGRLRAAPCQGTSPASS